MKFDAEFKAEWLKRYGVALAQDRTTRIALRRKDGCMCAMGIAYNMLVEKGIGKWVDAGKVVKPFRRDSSVELFEHQVNGRVEHTGGGITMLMNILGVPQKHFGQWASVVRKHDGNRPTDVIDAIVNLPEVA